MVIEGLLKKIRDITKGKRLKRYLNVYEKGYDDGQMGLTQELINDLFGDSNE